MKATVKRNWADNFNNYMSWRFTQEEQEIYDLLKRRSEKEIVLHNFDKWAETFEFSEFEKYKKYRLDMSFFEHLFTPIFEIPVKIIKDNEETEEEIIWPYDEEVEEVEETEKVPFYKNKFLVKIWVIILIVLFLIWLFFKYVSDEKAKQIEKQKQELLIKDKYQVLTDLDNDLNLKIDEELRKQEQIKLDLANSYEKVKNLKAQKEKNLNDKIKLTN